MSKRTRHCQKVTDRIRLQKQNQARGLPISTKRESPKKKEKK